MMVKFATAKILRDVMSWKKPCLGVAFQIPGQAGFAQVGGKPR